ncbi:hypothetical protein [Alkalihalobacterium chitinilyticum]|uniref:Uncharacterized protein n=1 Tax=Alkalihalobacterium chitinilyticum TaxID=2980103 RepID=A0ABT5VL97_9BACI|nr:hypothetical protein [Alkalihalobacterium chitinilyticum]MDE5416072.1 hypothetical protein [Alkalihalobacterium chitinilyticum]
MRPFAVILFLGLFLSLVAGCNSTEALPEELEELRPSTPGQYYIIGFQKNDWELEELQQEVERFIDDERVVGVSMFYKVTEEHNVVLKKYNFNLSSGFVVLEYEGTPYYVSSYSGFESTREKETH